MELFLFNSKPKLLGCEERGVLKIWDFYSKLLNHKLKLLMVLIFIFGMNFF